MKYLYSLFLVLIMCSSVLGAARYVRKLGNDSNTGASWAQAWQTVTKVNASAVAGDSIIFGRGRWINSQIIPKNGNASTVTYYMDSAYVDPASANFGKYSGVAQIIGADTIPKASWSVYSGNVYRALYTATTFDDEYGEGANVHYADQDGVPLVTYGSIPTAAGRFYHSGGYLYVWCFGNVNPNTVEIMAATKSTVKFTSNNQDYNYFGGLDIRSGRQGTVLFVLEGADYNTFRYCKLSRVAANQSANPAIVYSNGHGGSHDSTGAWDIPYARWNTFNNCSLSVASSYGGGIGAHGGSGFIFYDGTDNLIDSCIFVGLPGDGIEVKNSALTASGTPHGIWARVTVRNSNFYNLQSAAVNIYTNASQCSVYNNIIVGAYDAGVIIGNSTSTANWDFGKHFIANNTFYQCTEMIQVQSVQEATHYATGLTAIIKHNIGYDITSSLVSYRNFYDFRDNTTGLTVIIDSNQCYEPGGAFQASWNGGTVYDWNGWRGLGFDLHGLNTNPNFVDLASFEPTTTGLMPVRIYGGISFSRWGATRNGSGSGCQVGTPVLSLPLNGAANLTNPVVFDWDDVATATSYTINVATDAAFTNLVVDQNPTTSTYTSSVFQDGTTYYWRVLATSSCGVSSWSPYRIFSMACTSTPSVTLSSPANLATNQSLSLTLDWADASASLYQVQLSLAPAFTTNIIDQTPSVSTYAVSGLNYANTYHWRVRAQNACGWGAWSSASFSTLVAPTAGAEVCTLLITSSANDTRIYDGAFSSNAASGQWGYGSSLNASTSGLYLNVPISNSEDIDSAFAFITGSGATAGGVINIRISAENNSTPAAPTALANFSSKTRSTTYVDWNGVPNLTDGQIVKSPDIGPVLSWATSQGWWALNGNLQLFFDNIGNDGGYFRSTRTYDYGPLDAIYIIVYRPPLNTAPTVPVLSAPTGNGSTNTITPNLIINNSTDANGDVLQYIFEISADLNFDTILVQSPFVAQGVSTTSWTSTVNLTNGVIYYWRARAYDGTVYSQWSSGNEFIVATTRLIDINQAWRNSTNGVINTANGFQTGDVVRLTSNITTPDNWGIIINTRAVTLNADGYTIQCNNITVPSIVNPSFETGTGTSADGWDFTAAPNAQRLAGQYDEIAEYSNPSTLMTGDYSLRFQVPCSTQTVVSSSTYTLDANRNWAICAAYYNQIQNPSLDPSTDHVRITIGFVSTAGDTLFSSEYLRGMMYRGPEPIVVHYKTTASTTGKIFFRLRGTSTITSTNSYIWVDDVKIIPFAPFSVGIAIDTTELRSIAQGGVRAYDAVGDTMMVVPSVSRLFSGYPTTSNVGDSVTIRNAVLRNNSAGGYNAFGIFIGYAADSISLYNSDVLTAGPNCHNIFSGSAFYNNVFYNTFEVNAPYGLARESVPSTNIDFTGGKGNGARGSVIYGNTFSGSIWCSIVIQNRCDASIDGIDTYPVPIVRKNTFYCTTKLTNGFVVDFTGQGGFVFDSNSVFGSGEYHGTGVHVQYQNPACEQWVVIRDNYISVSPDTVNQEYPYGTLAYGIQLEQAPRCSVLTNYIVAVTDHINDPSAMALRINDGDVPSMQVIAGNTFVGISNDSANSPSACLQFGSPEAWDYDGITKVMEFGYNTFNSNSAWIRGFTKIRNWQPNNNVFVINDSLPIMPDFTALSSTPVASGVPTDIRFLNNRFGSDSAKSVFKDAYIRSDHGLTSAKALSQWFYVHQVGVSVASLNTGLFLPDIEVIAYDNVGGLQDIDTTDVYGRVYLLAREFQNMPLTSTYNVNTDKTYYNPITIIARTLNQVLAETLVVAVDTLIHVNMNLDFNQYPTVSSPPFFDIFKPINNKVIPPLFNADTVAHFMVYDDFGIKDINVFLRGTGYNKNIFSSSYSVGSRPSFQEISFAYDTQYGDTLAQYIVFTAEDDSLDIDSDSMAISIPIGTNITIAFGGKYITDNKLDVTSPTINLSSATSFRTSPTGSRGWLSFDMQALKGDSLPAIVDIVSSTLRLYNNERNGSGTIGIHDVFKNGVTHESMSYNRFDRVGLLEWGVAGANSTGDYPTCDYNTTDAGGCDRTASALSLISPALNAYNTWTIPDSTLQFMFDGTKPNNGWLFVATGTSNCTFYTVEGASPPLATITYQVPRPIPVGNLYNPVLSSIGSKSITENQLLSFTISASDADLTTPNFLIAEATLPTGAVLTDNDNGTALFSWTPLYTQSGIYNVLFIATDGQKTDSEMVTITVVEFGDRAPIITGITNRSVAENSLLSFTVTGSDADGDLIDISATGLPSGSTFIYDSYLMSANFFWTPTYTQAGSYNVTFIVTELTSGTLSTSYPFVITVSNTNRAPVLTSIGSKSVNENVLLSFNMTATDADNEVLTFSGTNLPAGSNITNISNGNAQFNWQPNLSQSGVYNATINVSDGITTDFEVVQITVADVAGTTTVTISGTTNVEDAYLRPSQPNANYSNYTGGSHGMYVYTDATTTGRGVLKFNLTGALPPEAIITNAYIKFTVFQYNAAGTIYAARVFQPWVEGNSNGGTTAGVSYNHFDITGAKTWTLAGAKSTSDAGVDNTTGTVGTHFDAALTPAGFVTPVSTGVYNLILPNSLVQGWRAGTIANNGVVLYSAGNFAIYQSETATTTNRPELIIEYTTSAPGKPHRRFPLRGLNSGVLK